MQSQIAESFIPNLHRLGKAYYFISFAETGTRDIWEFKSGRFMNNIPSEAK